MTRPLCAERPCPWTRLPLVTALKEVFLRARRDLVSASVAAWAESASQNGRVAFNVQSPALRLPGRHGSQQDRHDHDRRTGQLQFRCGYTPGIGHYRAVPGGAEHDWLIGYFDLNRGRRCCWKAVSQVKPQRQDEPVSTHGIGPTRVAHQW